MPNYLHPIIFVAALTYRRPKMLAILLEKLMALQQPSGYDTHFLVVDNDAGASARHVVESFALRFGEGRFVYVVEPEPGIPAARNRALDQASGAGARLLCFLDDDEYPDPTWLKSLVAHFESTGAVLIGGPCITTAAEGLDSPWARFVARSIVERNRFMRGYYERVAANGDVPIFSTDNCLIDLAWIRQTGLTFDPALRFTGGEDTAFWQAAVRLGGNTSWCTTAVVYETLDPVRASLRYQLRRSISNGVICAYLAPETPWRAVPRQIFKIVSGAGLIAIPVFGTASLMLGIRRIGMGIGWLAGMCGVRSSLYARPDRKHATVSSDLPRQG